MRTPPIGADSPNRRYGSEEGADRAGRTTSTPSIRGGPKALRLVLDDVGPSHEGLLAGPPAIAVPRAIEICPLAAM